MAALRTTGSFRRFFIEGQPLDLDSPELFEAIEANAFRSIHDSASEQESSGWVSPWDPTGRSFDRDEIRIGDRLALTLRVDRKRVPPALLRIYCAAEERAELQAAGLAKISRARRLEIRQRVEGDLRRRALPNLTLHQLILDPSNGNALFFGTAEKVIQHLVEIFQRTFDRSLIEATPGQLAERLEGDPQRRDYIERSGPLLLMPTPGRLLAASRRSNAPGAQEPPPESNQDGILPASPPAPDRVPPMRELADAAGVEQP